MSRSELLEQLHEQYDTYLEDKLHLTKEQILGDALEIAAYGCIHDRLTTGGWPTEVLEALFKQDEDNVIAMLVYDYWKSDCDLCNADDLDRLIIYHLGDNYPCN